MTRASKLFALMSRLPPGIYLKFAEEMNEDDEPFVSCCWMERAPINGWRTRSEYFGHTPIDYDVPCAPAWMHSDVARWGVSAKTWDGLLLTLLPVLERRLQELTKEARNAHLIAGRPCVEHNMPGCCCGDPH